jgi:hypothetical protein
MTDRDELRADTIMNFVRPLTTNDAESWTSLRREALENHPLVFGASKLPS